MKKPLIGVTCRYNEENEEISLIPTYMNAVAVHGAVPILLYCTEDEALLRSWVDLCDGLMISGGPDVDPSYYGEERHEKCGPACPSRDRTESRLFEMFREAGKPILGICRGAQLVNALLGGTLYQDVPSQYNDGLVHSIPNLVPAWHSMNIVPGTRLHKMLGVEECTVNSFHHQAVLKVAPGMRVAANAPGGLIEAIESTDDSWLFCIQWHPERTFQDDEVSNKLFGAFVDACR